MATYTITNSLYFSSLFQIVRNFRLTPTAGSRDVKPFVRTVLTLGNDLPIEFHDRWAPVSSGETIWIIQNPYCHFRLVVFTGHTWTTCQLFDVFYNTLGVTQRRHTVTYSDNCHWSIKRVAFSISQKVK